VCQAIDAFGRTHTGLINIGEAKGAVICDLIAQHRPRTMLELGGYVGYSAILFGDALRRAGGTRYLSVEKSPLFAAVAASLIDLAGLRDVVRVVVGTGAEGIQRLYDEGLLGEEQVGMVFFDHHKPSYTADLKRCERLGLVGKGTVLVADNMIIPGNPEYEGYVRASVAEKRERDKGAGAGGQERGDPNLQYASRSVTSYEPSGQEDGIEITECLGAAA
jgi:catechol O-methyltransferase